ncbi:uncharacterized protein LOC133911575 [Phragmites australis]|uniref:uncharacterized protein LOC133911575 n=1 Tax=Phragmites australis TaxID=29695 RepID=UPI002D76EB8F|nr:uncharacterized protein LOC133911575 [Phragmites australis]
MEVDGEGGGCGGGEVEGRSGDLETLLQAIRSTEVLENRISLINQLEGSFGYSADDLSLILDTLIVSWDDSRCSGVSHFMLHKSVLQVALKCSDIDTTDCLGQFLSLGVKASSWCGKHLLWSVESIDESEEVQEEEHSRLLPEIISLTLNISIKLLPSAAKCISADMVHTIRGFILELLTLMESSIVDNKKIHGSTPDIAKAAPVFLDETIKLCKAYSEIAKADNCKMSTPKEETNVKHREPDLASDWTRITASTIQTLCKLGTYAASSGGSQVTLLNVSWKGVVSLLQIGKGMIEEKINVGDIILTLVSLIIESLKVAAETWCTPLLEALGTSEARRAFLPIKFFLINALRICSAYPSEAMTIYKNIIKCALVITSSSILFSKEPQLKAANEALVELLEPTSFLLLDTLMKSSEVTPESKCQLVHYFFENEEANSSVHMGQADQREINLASLDCIFPTDSDVHHRNRALLPAELIVFLHFLNASPWLREEVVIELSKKLQALLNIFTSEDIYSYVLGYQIPSLYGADHSPAVVWQPVYTSLIQALKTFMISSVASSAAWNELEAFLLENLFHPHFLCLEIITELWCFFMRYAETETANYLVNQLLLLLKTVASPEKVLAPLSALRKVARALCIILSYASSATVDRIYTRVLNDENTSKSSILHLALLMEGFPFDSLSGGAKELAVKNMHTSFAGYLESYSKNHRATNLPTSSSVVTGLPVHALASALQRCEIKDANVIDERSITTMFKFTTSLINMLGTAPDSSKDHLAKDISSMLDIISNMRHLCAFSDMQKLTLELHTLFLSTSDNQNAVLSQCKPSMASFMAILGHLNVTENDANELCSAMCDLYHFLLRERHWALIHLAMGSFGYFAARTSFTELWKFVPGDAALSYNAITGTVIDENRFMLELKDFLQKEAALHGTSRWSEKQICFLVSEGRALKKLVKTYSEIPEISEPEKVAITKDVSTKKRKMPDGVCEGMVLLQNGLKVMRSAFDESDFAELRDRFAAPLSRLEDAVSQIASMSDDI